MRVRAKVGDLIIDVLPMNSEEFAELKSSHVGQVEAVPTYYDVISPWSVWPVPRTGVKLIYEDD